MRKDKSRGEADFGFKSKGGAERTVDGAENEREEQSGCESQTTNKCARERE